MTTPPPRDWDKELAEIDKLIGKAPGPAPSSPVARAPGAKPPALVAGAAPSAPIRRSGGAGGTWLRVGLGAALGVGMTQWPYAHTCGLWLGLYLGAVSAVALSGLWGAVSSWRRRIPAAHLLSMAVVLWGLVLVADVVLPRTGYAAQTLTWLCP